MIYTSRLVGAGNYLGEPMVVFTLASKSIPFRELRANVKKGRINVFPKKGFENHPTNLDPEVDNYSCIRTGRLNIDEFMASFNGHMCKRAEAHLRNGMTSFASLDLTLLDFNGAPNDARIGVIVRRTSLGKTEFVFGINDVDRGEKRIVVYPNEVVRNLDDRILFVYDKDTARENVFDFKDVKASNAHDLARHIHKNIIGQEIAFGLGTAVALMKPDGFEFGVYNRKVNRNLVARWEAEMEAKSVV